jgi:hypothetical protein
MCSDKKWPDNVPCSRGNDVRSEKAMRHVRISVVVGPMAPAGKRLIAQLYRGVRYPHILLAHRIIIRQDRIGMEPPVGIIVYARALCASE